LQKNTAMPILIIVDFSDNSLEAAIQAANLAELLHEDLLLVHAVNHYTRAYLHENNLDSEWIEESMEWLSQKLTRGREIDVEFVIREGSVYEVISKISRESNALLIAFSLKGKPGLQKFTPEKIMRMVAASPIPSIIFPRHVCNKFSPMLFPVNLFRGWAKKAKALTHLSQWFGKQVIVVENHSSVMFASEIERERYHFSEKLNSFGLECTFASYLLQGSYTNQLAYYAKRYKAGLLVLMNDEEEESLHFRPGLSETKIIRSKIGLPVLCVSPYMFSQDESR